MAISALLASYTRKDGFGNRDVLDFPLFFALKGVLGGNGFGDMRQLEFASFDGSDGNANDGSRGVMFAGSHDDGNTNLSTLAHAHILTRPGFPLVYYNAKEFGTGRDFPKDGRGDALGNFNSDIIPRLVQINNVYASEFHQTRWIDDNIYIYERNLLMLVGLNDRGDDGFDERTVQTSFGEGTILTELTGNATSGTVDPFDDIADTITVGANGAITVRVPRNSADGSFHGRGFVMYGPEAPRSTLSLGDVASIIPADPEPMTGDVNQDVPAEGRRRVTPIPVLTTDTIDVELTIDQSGPLEDFAMVKLDYGLPIDANNAPGEEFSVFSPRGRFAGFEQFTDLANPSVSVRSQPVARGNTPTTPGLYRLAIDATVLEEGIHYLETVAFFAPP